MSVPSFAPRFDVIDLSGLPAPAVVEELDVEAIVEDMKAAFLARHPEYEMASLETDPIVKFIQVAAFREVLLRARVNDAARAVMLAFAGGTDLDHLGALYKTGRKVIEPGNPGASPPAPPVTEPDGEFRQRVQLAPEAMSTAGPVGAYLYHAMSAHPDIKSANVYKSAPGAVQVIPLTRHGDGLPDADVIEAARERLRRPTVRPLTDIVTVRAPERIDFQIAATLLVSHGPDAAAIRAEAEARLAELLAKRHQVGRPVYRSAISAALSVAGVETVVLASPAADIEIAPDEVAWATEIDIAAEIAA